ncbi:MAG: ribosomal protein S18-alanine N-acetyltransferase [Pyrinomonadaceae bacterium]
MAVFQKILEFFTPLQPEPEIIVSAPLAATYQIRPLTDKHLDEVLHLNRRCFKKGENYTKYTFSFLLSEPNTLSYRIASQTENMVAFIFVTVGEDGAGHITTVGVAPEHRRRGLARKLLAHVEEALKKRGISTICLEVRIDNIPAQMLYRHFGYAIVQKLPKYYNNGEDGFLMVKSLS